jgi:hypothetical protein
VSKIILLLIFATLILFVNPIPVRACSCVQSSETKYFQDADMVFVGTATKIETNEYIRSITFHIEKPLKGIENQTQVIVKTGIGGGDCGYEFQIGLQYKVNVGKRSGSELYTGVCSGNQLLLNGKPGETTQLEVILIGIILVVGIIVSTLVVIYVRRKRYYPFNKS